MALPPKMSCISSNCHETKSTGTFSDRHGQEDGGAVVEGRAAGRVAETDAHLAEHLPQGSLRWTHAGHAGHSVGRLTYLQ